MRSKQKKALAIAGAGLAMLLVVCVFTAVLLFDINYYKSKVETNVSEITGLNVKINGKMRISFFPFGLSVKDIHCAGRKGEILSLSQLEIGANLLPLFQKKLIVDTCTMIEPVITIVKDSSGRYNFETVHDTSTRGRQGMDFHLRTLTLSKGSIVHLDKMTGEATELKDINFAINDVSIMGAYDGIMRNISFTGTADCKELRKKGLRVENIKSGIKAQKGIFSLDPLTFDVFDTTGEGSIITDRTRANTVYAIVLKITKLDFEKLEESFGVKKLIGGKGDLAASLTVQDKGERNLIRGTSGTLSLQGTNLVTHTVDLDKLLSSYESSQTFNLVDVGSFFIAGPLGAAAVRGYRYGDMYYRIQGGRGSIRQFVSIWDITNGTARATDCALSTDRHRVAIKGTLNLSTERYDRVTVALLDEKGCAQFKQSVSGSFLNPQIGVANIVESLTGQISGLYKKTRRLVGSDRCEVFYNGVVKHPR